MEIREIEELAALLGEHPVTEISVEYEGSRVRLKKGGAPARTEPVHAAVVEPTTAEEPEQAVEQIEKSMLLVSEMVGLFRYVQPAVQVGDLVTEGQVVGNIESLKLMNEVVAGLSGKVVDIMVRDGSPVDYGLPLYRLIPA
jgi:biotin carboxyl carrier protein